MLGLVGAAVPLLVLFFVYNSAVQYILTKFNVLTVSSRVSFRLWRYYRTLLPIGLGFGIGIGFIGSIINNKETLRGVSE